MEKSYTFHRDCYPSKDGRSQVACYFYVPSAFTPRAVVQISHGMCEYVKRYEPFAEYLCQKGYVVCGNDHLGHGETAANERELGYTAKGGGAEYMVEDVYTLTQKIRAEYQGLPVILLGHSMGSFIARYYLKKYPNAVEAAIISGTGGPESPTALGKALTRCMMLFFGEHHRSNLIKNIVFFGYNKRFADENSQNSWISRDKKVVERYSQDPYCRYVFTLRGYYDLFYLLGVVSKKTWPCELKQDLPILIISGDMDPVGNYGKGVKTVYDRMIQAGMRDVVLKLYSGARHEVLNEINRQEVFLDIINWLEEKGFYS